MRADAERRVWTIRAIPAALLLATFSACGGGGDTPVDPTPPPPTVASVTVSPTTAALTVPATVQLTATARDANGNAMNATIAWSSSASTVATVSQTGLVTSVSAGTAIITATAGAQSASATITVSVAPTSPYGPVVDRRDITSAGGTVGNADVAVTIPAGSFLSTRTIEVVRDTTAILGVEGQPGSARYVVNGFPANQVTAVAVRIKPTTTVSGSPAIALQRPAQEMGDSVTTVLGLELQAAHDSSGYMVATVPIAGRPVGAGLSVLYRAPVASAAAAPFDPSTMTVDGLLSIVLGLRNVVSPSGRFDIWGAIDDPDMAAKQAQAAAWMDAAHTKLTTTYGYAAAHRNRWPMQVMVEKTTAGWNGVFRQYGAWPFDVNFATIGMNRTKMGRAEQPGTAIHELYHFMQQAYRDALTINQYGQMAWYMEATSTWMSEFHPQSPTPFFNTTAQSWRDSLYSGLHPLMVASSGYGKAPMIKYIAKRWGNDKVKEIWTSVRAGTNPIGALVGALPEPPSKWWPEALTQQFGGSLYPWTVEQIIPQFGHFGATLRPGRLSYQSALLAPLGVNVIELIRDTAMFGPAYQLPVYIDTASIGLSRVVVLEKPAAATHFRPIAGTDTEFIPGHRLQSRDTILMLVTATQPVQPPYNTGHRITYGIDLRLPEGDWRATSVTGLNRSMVFACDQPGDSVSFDPASNAKSVIGMFANAGTWKRQPLPVAPATYTWTVNPGYVDSLAMLGITMESVIRESAKDTVYLSARLRWNLLSASTMQRIGSYLIKGELGGWWWMLVPIGLVPLAKNKRTRRVLPVVGAAFLLVFTACGVGFIGWDIDESLDYAFTKVRFTADANAPTAPLLQVSAGAGKTVLNRFRTEAWIYTYDVAGAKTDSTKRTCTGTGNATYTVNGLVYADGVVPPEDEDDSSIAALVERATGRPGLAAQIRARRAAGHP